MKGLGYNGAHIGGVHSSFGLVKDILDRFEDIQDQWQEFLPEFNHAPERGFYAFPQGGRNDKPVWDYTKQNRKLPLLQKLHFAFMRINHHLFFNFESPLTPVLKKVAVSMDKTRVGKLMVHLLEEPIKILMLGCERCGDCAIQHVGFLCPQNGCPKQTRNGPCGGSCEGRCEVRPERDCVWFRAFNRLASIGKAKEMLAMQGCVPPRMWELNHTPSWLNFYLGLDHQSCNDEFSRYCQTKCISITLSESE